MANVLRFYGRENQNLVSEVTVSHTREASFLFNRAWTLRLIRNLSTAPEESTGYFVGRKIGVEE